MKAAKKIMASALALTMAASAGIGTFAANENIATSSGSEAKTQVTITSAKVQEKDENGNPVFDEAGNPVYTSEYEAPVFSVTLPASLPLTINADGSVNAPTADAFKITNGSAGPVKVTNVEFVNGTNWSFVPYEGSDFASMQVDSHKLGLSLTAKEVTVKTGDEGEALKPNWTIAKGGELGITAAAAASAVSQTVTEENAASVVFTVGWDAAGSAATGNSNSGGESGSNGGEGSASNTGSGIAPAGSYVETPEDEKESGDATAENAPVSATKPV